MAETPYVFWHFTGPSYSKPFTDMQDQLNALEKKMAEARAEQFEKYAESRVREIVREELARLRPPPEPDSVVADLQFMLWRCRLNAPKMSLGSFELPIGFATAIQQGIDAIEREARHAD